MKNFLKIPLLFLILFFINNYSFSQSKRIYIQIDTIETYDKIETLINFKIEVYIQDHLHFEENESSETDKSVYKLNEYPNYTTTLKVDFDASEIRIPIDLNGSEIILENIYHLDTIRINRIQILKTQPPDTTYSTIYKTKVINGERDEIPFSVEKKVNSKKTKSPTDEISLVVNGKKYPCSLDLTEFPEISIINGHGYNPEKRYKKNGEDKKKVIYMYSSGKQIRYHWEGRIRLIR
jgi:hypothetical protein